MTSCDRLTPLASFSIAVDAAAAQLSKLASLVGELLRRGGEAYVRAIGRPTVNEYYPGHFLLRVPYISAKHKAVRLPSNVDKKLPSGTPRYDGGDAGAGVYSSRQLAEEDALRYRLWVELRFPRMSDVLGAMSGDDLLLLRNTAAGYGAPAGATAVAEAANQDAPKDAAAAAAVEAAAAAAHLQRVAPHVGDSGGGVSSSGGGVGGGGSAGGTEGGSGNSRIGGGGVTPSGAAGAMGAAGPSSVPSSKAKVASGKIINVRRQRLKVSNGVGDGDGATTGMAAPAKVSGRTTQRDKNNLKAALVGDIDRQVAALAALAKDPETAAVVKMAFPQFDGAKLHTNEVIRQALADHLAMLGKLKP
jgi:hypothetical protein